ncbi:NADPH-dependent FMN reductase [Stenomitos frigidus]|uniref:NADPH-dependent FMN reductase n=1 Tax=Stenomitos frigidus TaxID=1886765 RepID=UPI001FE62E9D|nr:NAD(P)H-dependent oxidoreductase [Stenomitos frigidus]
MVRFVGIAGSLRADSYSQQALVIATQRLEALGAEVERLDLQHSIYRSVMVVRTIQTIQT